MKRIVWIASYPKSGNTWVRLFIAALRARTHGRTDARTHGRTDAYDPNQLSTQPDFYQDNARWLYEPCFRRGWGSADKTEMARARPVVQNWIAKNAKTAAPIVKTHNALISVAGVPVITPEVTRCAIYVVRHPFDVAVSVKDHFGAKDYDQAIAQMTFKNYVQPKDERFIDAPVGSWSQNVLSWTEKADPKINVFRYEDMLEQSEVVFTKIAAILGVKDKKTIAAAIDDVDFATLQKTETERGFVERSSHTPKFFARGQAGHGAALLTRDQKAAIAQATSAAAALHGYDLSE